MSERDTQRSKLYKAERQALSAIATPVPKVADVERYIRKQMKRQTLVRRYGNAVDMDARMVEVADGRGCRRALAYGAYKIALPLWARQDWTILHEMAHIIHERLSSPRHRGGDRRSELAGGAAHGWQFAAVYLDLVQFCMGAEAGAALKAAFKENRVRFRPKRVVSPEQAERLAACRRPL